jgi:flagellar motor switch protein FliN/FliY
VLAEREMALQEVLRWTPGSIIEFEQSADTELDLVVGNRAVGAGQAVKVGENFGIRITAIGEMDERIRAMGP